MIRITIYILRGFVPWLAIGIGACVLIFLSTQLIRVAPVFLGAGASLWQTGIGIGLLLVPVVAWALTPAFAVAAFSLAGQLSEEGELTVLDAAGLGRNRAIAGLAALMVALFGLSTWLWLFACPGSQADLRALAAELAGRALNDRLTAHTFTEVVPGVTFYADRKQQGAFRGILIEDARDENHPVQLVAAFGTTAFDPLSRSLGVTLEKGTVFMGSGGRADPEIAVSFDSLDLRLPLAEIVARRIDFLPPVMAVPTSDLLGAPLADIQDTDWQFALWRRIASPVGFLMLSGLCLYLAFGATWRRRNAAIAVAVGLFGLFHLAGRLAESLMRERLVSPFGAAFWPLLLVGVALVALPGVWFLRIQLAKIVR